MARANDLTGRQSAVATKEHAQEISERRSRLTTATARVERDMAEEVSDPEVLAAPTVIDEVEQFSVELGSQTSVISVSEEITDMTFGIGNTYSFQVGKRYKIDKNLLEHLQSLGRVYRVW
jgi:hypothetical protein